MSDAGIGRTVCESKPMFSTGWCMQLYEQDGCTLYLGYLGQACLVVYGVQFPFKVASEKSCYLPPVAPCHRFQVCTSIRQNFRVVSAKLYVFANLCG